MQKTLTIYINCILWLYPCHHGQIVKFSLEFEVWKRFLNFKIWLKQNIIQLVYWLALLELGCTAMDIETFPNHLDGLNDKSTARLKDFHAEEPNWSRGHQSTLASVLQRSCTMAPPSTSNLLEQNPFNEAPLSCQSN